MELRINVLALTLSLLGGLFSCSQEEMVDIPDGKETCDVSLMISMGDIQTKAAPNYQYATSDELKISNCHVAVFEVDDATDKPTSRIYYKDFSGMGEPTPNVVDQLSGYKLELSGVRTFGKDPKRVRVLVVANGDNNDFAAWISYDDHVKGSVVTTFNESSLVKVGLSSVTRLIYGQDSPTEISVTLNQLSAKIIYEGVFNVDEPDKPNDDFSLIEVSGINKKSNVAIFSTSEAENEFYESGSAESTSFYTYETKDAKKELILSIGKGGASRKISFDLNRFVKGNLYKIKGTYNPTVPVKIKWEVEPVGIINIPVKPFE